LKFQGINVGSSKCEVEAEGKNGKIDIVALAGELLEDAKQNNVQVFLPIDHLINSEFKANANPTATDDANIPAGFMALDVGPKTRELYQSELSQCKTVIWNGPVGVFELAGFEKGTYAIAATLANSGIISIVGGGDSASAAEKSGFADKLSHISTGGGASLELLEGKVLPGLSALTDKK